MKGVDSATESDLKKIPDSDKEDAS